MQVNHILEVENKDTIQTLHKFLVAWWGHFQPQALLAPVEDPLTGIVNAQVIEDPADLARVNPFVPIMTRNSAGMAYQLRQERPNQRLGAILRPCELRTYNEMRKRDTLNPNNGNDWNGRLVIISADCMGTYSLDDYNSEAAREGSLALARETLSNASTGGFKAQKYRTACQICDWPAPWGADVAIGTIGVDTNKYLLLIARDEICSNCLELGAISDHPAIEYQVSRRETVVGAVADAHTGVRKHLITNTPGYCRFDDLGSMLAWFASCSLCGKCLEACPLYQGELDGMIDTGRSSTRNSVSLSELVRTSRWLASCSGCGMCEEKCRRKVPLTLFIAALSHRIQEENQYIAGDPNQRLPWVRD
jgi:formate dehydrogenase subunit beta